MDVPHNLTLPPPPFRRREHKMQYEALVLDMGEYEHLSSAKGAGGGAFQQLSVPGSDKGSILKELGAPAKVGAARH